MPPAHRWVPPHDHTNGDFAADLGVELGLTPDEDQRDILNAIYAYNDTDPGMPTCSTVGVVSPRQNLKTSTLEIAALTDLFVFREPLHVWTAHLTKTSRKTFEHMCALIDANVDLKALCRPHRTANGSEAIELWTGERIEFYARSKGAGRGITARKITMDEALFLEPADMGALGPTLVTIPDAQIRYGSSAGLAASAVLRDIRDRGRAANERRLGYFEWCAPVTECASEACPHRPVDEVPGCALDNRDLWRAANPAFGRRISEEALLEQRKMLPPEEFAREFLGWWDEPETSSAGIPAEAWRACSSDAQEIIGQPMIGLDVALDRSHASISVAGQRSDVATQVELADYRPGTAWVAARLAEMYQRWQSPVHLDATGPAASLLPDLEAAGVPVVTMARSEVVQACGAFYDAVRERTLAHLDDPILNTAVAGARLRPGEAFVFTRKGNVDISPLYAATLAHRAATVSVEITQAVW